MQKDLTRLTVVAVAMVLLAPAAYYVMWFVAFWFGVPKAEKAHVARHREATIAIEYAYRCYLESGRWPESPAFGEDSLVWVPEEWIYSSNSEAASIRLHGPLHMILWYDFAPPVPGSPLSRTWELSIEGDKQAFQTDLTYRVPRVSRRGDGVGHEG